MFKKKLPRGGGEFSRASVLDGEGRTITKTNLISTIIQVRVKMEVGEVNCKMICGSYIWEPIEGGGSLGRKGGIVTMEGRGRCRLV